MSKSKKSKTKSVSSIAIKINAINVRDMFVRFLLIDILIMILIIGFWCIDAEKYFYGDFVKKAERSIVLYPIEEAYYSVTWNEEETMNKDASEFILSLKQIMMVILIVEGVLLLEEIVFGTAKVRKRLRPLNELAETANRLSDMVLDDEKFHKFEDAISRISPVGSNERITIEDSEFKGLEQAINQLLDRMRDSYRQQARFVSDASHELRTPISVIQGYANMLHRWGKNDPSVLDESIEAIKSESENMKNLVEQLLFLARGINGKTQLSLSEFSLTHMIEEVCEESKMIDSNHVYNIIKTEDINIYGDQGLLKQTARILVDNAVKYTEEGYSITLKVGKNEKGEPFFAIQDSGIGIDEIDIPHIFERFFRADTARVRKDGGTGLGLSIGKWIVDNHKGYFGVISRKEIGTRISVFLPQILR